MIRSIVSIGIAIVAGVAAAHLLPPPWLAPLSAVAFIFFVVFAIIVRLGTETESPSSFMAGILLSAANLPEQSLAKVSEGWALSIFLASAAFLVSLGVSVMLLANA